MIVPLVVLATFLARISAQLDDIDTACVLPLQPYTSCTSALNKDCGVNQTLFDVLEPSELCTAAVASTTCGAALSSTTEQLDEQGCCTLTSLYPAMEVLNEGGGGNCSTSEPLSYEGFHQVVSYFCENQPHDGLDFYCLKDGQAYIELIQPDLMATQYAMLHNDLGAASAAFDAVDCNLLAATACCYPSMQEFIEGCGDANAQAMIPLLTQFLEMIPTACKNLQGVTVVFDGICPDLTEITNCFASDDPNCGSGNDDAAFSVMPTFASVFAAIAGFLFFARQL